MTSARMRVAFCTYLTNARNCHAEKVDCPFSISIFSLRNQMKQKGLKCYKQLSNDQCRHLDIEFLIMDQILSGLPFRKHSYTSFPRHKWPQTKVYTKLRQHFWAQFLMLFHMVWFIWFVMLGRDFFSGWSCSTADQKLPFQGF